MVSLAIISLIACSDNMGEGNGHNDGFLHFYFSFNSSNENAWREADGSKKAPRFEAPIKVEADREDFEPLYLHTVVEDHIDMPAAVEVPATRGQRYTGDAFYGDNSIKTFSVYGEFIEDGGGFSQMEGLEDFLCLTKDLTTPESDQEYAWRTTSITFSQTWGASQTANFYGCAPAGDDPTNPDCAKGVTTDTRNTLYGGVARPTLLYSMPAEEADHKDVLIAKTAAAVGKNDEIRLEFHHILSAIRFKYANSNGLKIKVKESDAGSVLNTYDVRVKKLQLQGIYKEGKCNMSQDLTSSNASTFWTVGTEKGDCAMDFTDEIRASLETGFFNDDAHCLMVLPQTAPTGAKVVLTCDLMAEVGGTPQVVQADVTFGASLTGKQWLPGYSYTYALSDTEFFYYIDAEDAETHSSTITLPLEGGTKDITVTSCLTNSTGGKGSVGVDWHPEYSTDGGATWTAGLPSGYALRYGDGSSIADLTAIPAGNTPTTYKLVAAGRSEGSTHVGHLLTKVYTDYDLSTKGGTVPRTTANTYIVDGVGTFKLPIVYGNAITQGADNPTAYTSGVTGNTVPHGFVNYKEEQITSPWIYTDTEEEPVNPCVVWQDRESLLTDLSITNEGTSGAPQHFLHFTVSPDFVRAGNSVIAVRDDEGTIMWSWLIWVTDHDYEHIGVPANDDGLVFTTKNVGWIEPETFTLPAKLYTLRIVQNIVNSENDTDNYRDLAVDHEGGTVSYSGSSLYFQFGRKDPMPGHSKDGNGTEYDMAQHLYNSTYPWELGTRIATSLSEGITKPYYYYVESVNDNWINKDYRDLWNIAQTMATKDDDVIPTKTVYDPCPPGFVTPPGKGYQTLGSKLSTRTHVEATTLLVRTYRMSAADGTFFDIQRVGVRERNTGEVEKFDVGFYYRTAERTGAEFARIAWGGTANAAELHGERYRSRGATVRAVRESWNSTSYKIPKFTSNSTETVSGNVAFTSQSGAQAEMEDIAEGITAFEVTVANRSGARINAADWDVNMYAGQGDSKVAIYTSSGDSQKLQIYNGATRTLTVLVDSSIYHHLLNALNNWSGSLLSFESIGVTVESVTIANRVIYVDN